MQYSQALLEGDALSDNFRIEPKKTIDIAREWLVVKGASSYGQAFETRAAELAEFADMLTKHLQFARDAYKNLAEDMLKFTYPKPIVISKDKM